MELKALENENCVISFSDAQEMQNALDQIMAGDSWHNVYAAKCRTSMDGEGIGILNTEAETVETGLIQREPKTYPMFSVAENTLSERSGSDASGNKFLNFEERLSVMNIYWAHHPEEEKCKLLVRGGHVLAMHSMQYNEIPQARLFAALREGLNHPQFLGGTYTHERTRADFALPKGVTQDYIDAWTRSGLPQQILVESSVRVIFLTNDIGTNTAEIIPMMMVGKCPFMIGDPIRIMHRRGRGDLLKFQKQVDSLDVTIAKEMEEVCKLMSIRIRYPNATMLRAMKFIQLPKLAKKACQEVLENCMYASGVSAYMLYLSINGIVDTEKGRAMSEERRFQLLSAIRRLLKFDWEAADKPGDTEIF